LKVSARLSTIARVATHGALPTLQLPSSLALLSFLFRKLFLETCLYFVFFIHVAKRAGTSFRGHRDHLPTSGSHVHAGHAGHAGQEDGTGVGLQRPVLRRMAETRVLHRARVLHMRTLNPKYKP
jgi:hypothetical protein